MSNNLYAKISAMGKPDIPDFFVNPKRFNSNFDPDQFLSKNKYLLLGIIFVLFILPNMFILVGAGKRAVVFNRITGMEKRVLEEGIQIVVPILEKATVYNVREISYLFSDKPERSRQGAFIMGSSIHTLTSDGQNITIDCTARARPDFKELWWLHQNIGQENFNTYVNKIIVPMVRSVVREVIAGYNVAAIYGADRRVIAEKISTMLEEKFKPYKITLSEFLLDEVTFSDAYQDSIEKKQQARIELDTKDNNIVEEENKRDAAITEAEGEAKAISLKVSALNQNPAYLKFRKAQVFGKRAKLVVDDSL